MVGCNLIATEHGTHGRYELSYMWKALCDLFLFFLTQFNIQSNFKFLENILDKDRMQEISDFRYSQVQLSYLL